MKKLLMIMGLLCFGFIYSSVEQSVNNLFTEKLKSQITKNISSDMSSADVINILKILKSESKQQSEIKAIEAFIDSISQSNSNGLLGSTGSSCMISCMLEKLNVNTCGKKCSN